jgi:hypothetical protein
VDALHLCHLIVLCLWGGVVLAESVMELAAADEGGRASAARVHFWIDVVVELPLIAGVLVTGALLASRSWPPSPDTRKSVDSRGRPSAWSKSTGVPISS